MNASIGTIGGIPFGPTGLIAAADWTRDRLVAFEVPFPSGNRLQSARSLMADLQAGRACLRPNEDDLIDRVTEAQWTIVEQYIITRALGLPDYRLGSLKRRKLEEMLSGAPMPAVDSNHLARNTQFELYVAALFTMGDVTARLGEPDVLIDYRGTVCGVAAKRVRSLRQAVRRADEAAEQLMSQRLRGFVAVNVDVLLTISEGGPGPESTLAGRLDIVDTIENRMADRDHVLGTITFGRDCLWNFTGERPRADVSHSYRFTTHRRADSDEAGGREFFDRMMARIDRRMHTL
jgi:hypothetical protein